MPFTGWQPYRPLITKLDTAGTVYSSSYYMVDSGFVGFDDYSFQQIVPSTNGSFYLSGWNSGNEHAIFRLDAGLNVEWIQYWSSGRVKQLTAGYNDDVWMVQDYGYANYIFIWVRTVQFYPGMVPEIRLADRIWRMAKRSACNGTIVALF
ncbi:MAG: hypothetical protein HWD58_11625 [Bacteroidota bacterium]|nr:MAG: hypothetical protein HWD58_11625 [Bacteroidota bacterium]